ncbi:MAG TPA: hypothetical protein VNN80_33770 [Polyangiaceae bacterium]|nr:hypothetical protein [Polyangiaceae bacterium]
MRPVLLHALLLVLVALGLLARMTESSDAQLALLQRSTTLARLDREPPSPAGAHAASPGSVGQNLGRATAASRDE